MKPRQPQWLLHPLFLISLFLLLLNDLSLKYVFHNAVTGKISDFAGLIVLSLFLIAYRPGHKFKILLLCAILFSWWKSPLSQPLIDISNGVLPFPISRVVDYSDLIALSVLPVVGWLVSRKETPAFSSHAFAIRFISIVSLFSFCNTSAYRYPMYNLPEDEVAAFFDYQTTKTEEEVLRMLTVDGSGWRRDSIDYYPAREAEFYYRLKQPEDSLVIWQPLTNKTDSAIYIRKKNTPYYLVRSYTLGDKKLKQLKFRFSRGKKKNTVYIESFVLEGYNRYSYPQNAKEIRKIKKAFKRLFKNKG